MFNLLLFFLFTRAQINFLQMFILNFHLHDICTNSTDAQNLPNQDWQQNSHLTAAHQATDITYKEETTKAISNNRQIIIVD